MRQDEPNEDDIAALVELLLSSSNPCELCNLAPQEHFLDEHAQWPGKHLCTRCFESLVSDS